MLLGNSKELRESLLTPQAPDGHRKSSARSWVHELAGGLLASLFGCVMNVATAAVIFHEGSPFGQYLAEGVTLFMVATGLGTAATAIVTRSGTQLTVLAILRHTVLLCDTL